MGETVSPEKPLTDGGQTLMLKAVPFFPGVGVRAGVVAPSGCLQAPLLVPWD